MVKLSYDLHLHSCLSPCGHEDMTPGNIVTMASIKELDVIALTDHNSSKNCPAFMEYAKRAGIIAIPGMELCTTEEVHVLCLFGTLADAMKFDEYVSTQLIHIPNNETIFGKQEIYNDNDEIIGIEPNLLINATNISFDQVYEIVKEHQGIMIPAHIDKNSYSVLSNLGFIPPDSKFKCVELKDLTHLDQLIQSNHYLNSCHVLSNSDAHYLEYINEPVNFLISESREVVDILQAITVSK